MIGELRMPNFDKPNVDDIAQVFADLPGEIVEIAPPSSEPSFINVMEVLCSEKESAPDESQAQ